jgi:hypothetical protein
MKLLYCGKCNDIFNLDINKIKKCSCGNAGGKYMDKINAIYWGEKTYSIGFVNQTFVKAMIYQPNQGMGSKFEAFVIPVNCPTMKKTSRKLS